MAIYSDDEYYPYSAALEVTLACNMKCIHCGSYADGRNRANPLTKQEWLKVIDDLKTLKTKLFTLSGGEPFLYPHWRELLSHIKSEGDTYSEASIITNGSKINEDDVVFMKKHNLVNLAISLDGTRDVHDTIRRTKGSFDMVMGVIDLCHKHNVLVSIATSVNQYNYDCIKDLLDILLQKKAQVWQFQIVNSFGRAGEHKSRMIISRDQYKKLIDDMALLRGQHKDQIKIFAADSIGYCHPVTNSFLDDTEWLGCSAGLFNIGIESNGTVKGCLSLQQPQFNAGNVRERSLIDIWKDDDAFAYTRKYDAKKMTGACKACEANEQCKAGCIAMAYSINNTLYENNYCYKLLT
ncbi:MAG: radical SAM protein [Deltaproteobacteria bacterium]|nr:radical SAM protein [Deltaproteobacteria bacterium]